MSDEDFFTDQAETEYETVPLAAGSVRKGSYVMLKGHPCKVTDISTSKTGKHGHAKAHFVGVDVFTGRKYEDIVPTSHNMLAPVLHRGEYELKAINDGFLSLIDTAGNERTDVEVPTGELGTTLQARFAKGETLHVTVIEAAGKTAVTALKEDS